MACIVIFPDRDSFQDAVELSGSMGIHTAPLEIPTFCRGIASPCLVTTAGLKQVVRDLESHGIPSIGAIRYKPFKREIPEAPPPDSQWIRIVGGIRIRKIRPSFTDPQRLRIETTPVNSLANLIPIMARLIRGGSFRPRAGILAFEEEHRLIAFSSDSIVISRADDLLDAWILLRCGVELICSAWNKQNDLGRERDPRHGIGAIEIFRRLPRRQLRPMQMRELHGVCSRGFHRPTQRFRLRTVIRAIELAKSGIDVLVGKHYRDSHGPVGIF